MAPSPARRRTLAVVASLAIAAAVATGLWWLRSTSGPEPVARSGQTTERPGEPPVRRGGSKGGPVAPRGVEFRDAGPGAAEDQPPADPEPETTSVGPELSLGQVAADAPHRITETVRPCWPGGRGSQVSHERVVVRYTLEITDGWAYARDVTMVTSDIQDEELRDCIVDRLTGLSWEVPGAPDVSRPMQTSVSTRDFTL